MAEQCGLCGGDMSKNPHPEAGSPSKLPEVGAMLECISCLTSARHGWASQLQQAQGEIERLKAAIQVDHFERAHTLYPEDPRDWKDCPLASCRRFKAALAEEDDGGS